MDWNNIINKPPSYNPSIHMHTSNEITSLTDYTKATKSESLTTLDSLNSALGKLEYKADLGKAVHDWYIGVTETDTDDIINKWTEIVNFIDSVKEGTDILDEFVTRKTDQIILGKKTFSSGLAITGGASERTDLPYFLGIDAFADGGSVRWLTSTKVCTAIGAARVDGSNVSGTTWNIDISGNAATAKNANTSIYANYLKYQNAVTNLDTFL